MPRLHVLFCQKALLFPLIRHRYRPVYNLLQYGRPPELAQFVIQKFLPNGAVTIVYPCKNFVPRQIIPGNSVNSFYQKKHPKHYYKKARKPIFLSPFDIKVLKVRKRQEIYYSSCLFLFSSINAMLFLMQPKLLFRPQSIQSLLPIHSRQQTQE